MSLVDSKETTRGIWAVVYYKIRICSSFAWFCIFSSGLAVRLKTSRFLFTQSKRSEIVFPRSAPGVKFFLLCVVID